MRNNLHHVDIVKLELRVNNVQEEYANIILPFTMVSCRSGVTLIFFEAGRWSKEKTSLVM